MSKVFVSYARKDIESVRPFYDLAAELKKDLWIDWNGIYPTENFMEKIFLEIEGADACVFMLSQNWLSSKSCRLEYEHAVRCKKRLIPVRCAPVEGTAVPEELARLNWVLYDAGRSVSEVLEEVFLAVDIDLEWVREHSRLLQSSRHWDEHHRNSSYCLRSRELRDLEQRISLLKQDTSPALTSLQLQFLSSSRAVVNSKMRTSVFVLSVAVFVFATLSVLATALYLQAERRRTLVSAQQLASRARLILQERADWLDPCAQAAADAVLRLGSIGEASVEANYALQSVGGLLPVRKSTLCHPSAVWDISVNDKGDRLACQYADYGQMPERWNTNFTDEVQEQELVPNRIVPIWNLEANEKICEVEWTGQDVIEHVQISHSGKLVLIASANCLEVWDIDTNVQLWGTEETSINAVAFSHDDSTIVVYADRIKVYDMSGDLVEYVDLDTEVYATSDSSLTEKYLMVYTEEVVQDRDEPTIRMLDNLLEAVVGHSVGQPLNRQLEHAQPTNRHDSLPQPLERHPGVGKFLVWRKRERWEPSNTIPFVSRPGAVMQSYGWEIRDLDGVAVLFQGKEVKVWNLEEDKQITSFKVGSEIDVVDIHPTEPLIAVATKDKITLWEIIDNEAVEVATVQGRVLRLQFSPDGRFLATASNDNTVRVLDLRDAYREAFRLVQEFWIDRFVFCGLSDRIVTACGFQALSHPDQANVRLWELTPTWRDCLRHQSATRFTEGSADLLTDAGVPTVCKGQFGITSLSGDETKILSSGPLDEVEFIDVSKDGTTAILAAAHSNSGTVSSFQVVGTGADKFQLPPEINLIDLSPDGKRIACCLANRLQVFEQGSNTPILDTTFNKRIGSVRFAPDSEQVVVSIGEGMSVKLVRLSDGLTVNIGAELRAKSIFDYEIHFSPNSQVLTLDGLDTVEAWKLSASPELIYQINDNMETGDISRSGNYLALKPHDRTIRIVDLRLGQVIMTVQDAEQILTCAFSPNEEFLATGSGDLLEQPKSNAIRIWEVASGRLLFQRDELVNPMEMEFTAGGDKLLTRKQDRSVSIYDWSADRLVNEVGTRLTGNMSKETWDNLLPGVDFRPTFSHLPITISSE